MVLAIAASAVVRALLLPNHDASWFTYVAAEVWAGASFFDRFADPNWPLAAYIMTPAGWLWRAGLPIAAALSLYVHAIAAGSVASCLHLLGRGRSPVRPAMMAGTLVVIALVLPGGDFGQREHLFVLLTLPYVVLAGVRLDGGRVAWPLAVAVGAAAGVGAGIKPFFLLAPVAVEAAVALRTRRVGAALRPETLAAAACALGADAAMLVAFPDYARFAAGHLTMYSAFRVPLAALAVIPLALVPGAIALFGGRTLRGAAPGVFVAAAAAVAATSVLFVAQGKGWSYHALPAYTLAAFLLGLVLAGAPACAERRRGAAIFLAALVGSWYAIAPVAAPASIRPYTDVLASRPGAFYALTVSVPPAFPAAPMLRKAWGGRINCLFLLPGVLAAERDAAASGAEIAAEAAEARGWLWQATAEDLDRHRPALVLVQRPGTSNLLPADLDILAWFQASPAFRTAWASYRKTGTIGAFDIYDRIPGDGSPERLARD